MTGVEVKRYGVSVDPLAIVVKYADTQSGKVMHHRVQLRNFGDLRTTAEKIMKRHARYFESMTVLVKVLGKLSEKVKQKQSEERLQTPGGWKKQKENRNDETAGSAMPSKKHKFETGTIQSNSSGNLKKSIKSPGLKGRASTLRGDNNDDGEDIIDDIDDADTLRSEDLGLADHRASYPKISNEGLPSLYNSKNLSKSKVSNKLMDSKKSLEKRIMNDLKDSAPRSDREKIFEESGTKFPYKKEDLPGLKKPVSDDFDDFDYFDVDVPRKDIPTSGLSQSKPAKKLKDSDGFDDFDDMDDFGDFDDIASHKQSTVKDKSMKESNAKPEPAAKAFDDFDDIEDFDEIEDEVEESQPANAKIPAGMSKTTPVDVDNDIKLSNLNIDYRTVDLNKLTNEEINMVKKTMDANFKQLKPGDEGFVYDKSISFNQEESNEWDD